MTRVRHCPRDPIGLSVESAAAFIGVSPELFQRAVDDGSMPVPRKLGGRLIWDAEEIAEALRRLPRKAVKESRESNDNGRWKKLQL